MPICKLLVLRKCLVTIFLNDLVRLFYDLLTDYLWNITSVYVLLTITLWLCNNVFTDCLRVIIKLGKEMGNATILRQY